MSSRVTLLGDGATNGATVSTINSGRKAGIAVDSVSIGAASTLTWDSTQKFFGTASMKVVTTQPANCYARFDSMFRPAGPDLVASVWMYFTAIPAASTSVFYVGDSAGARITELRLIATGKLQAYDSAGVAAVATVTSVAINQWVRCDFLFTPDAAAGKVQIKLFNTPASSTPTETTAQITALNLRTNLPVVYYFGTVNSSTVNQSFNLHGYVSDGAAAPFGAGWVQSRWVGAVTPSSVTVGARVMASAGVRLKVSTASNLLTAPVFSSSSVPDADGTVRLTVSGLTPNMLYFYGLEVDGVVDTPYNGQFRTFPTANVGTSFSFAAASCARNNSNSAAFDSIRARTGAFGRPALFFQHLGDLHYFADNTFDQTAYHTAYDKVMSAPKQLDFFGNIPTPYTWSDHDSGASNHDGTDASLPSAQVAYRSRVPSYTLPDANGIYYSYPVGRVLCIVTDGRSFMSPIAATDNAAKTKLGTTQKAWLKTQLSDPNYPYKIWFHEDAWANGATFVGDDTWSAYSTERAELGAYITANNVKMVYIHGDLHVLAADNGTNTVGGFPLFCASPLDNSAFIGNGTYTGGRYPLADSTPPTYYLQYGWFDVYDYGSSIKVAFTGYDSGGVARLAQSSTINLGGLMDVQGELNRLAKTVGLGEAGAANVYAGTTGLATVGALNVKAGNTSPMSYREMQGVCNQLAGTVGYGPALALNQIPTPV